MCYNSQDNHGGTEGAVVKIPGPLEVLPDPGLNVPSLPKLKNDH